MQPEPVLSEPLAFARGTLRCFEILWADDAQWRGYIVTAIGDTVAKSLPVRREPVIRTRATHSL